MYLATERATRWAGSARPGKPALRLRRPGCWRLGPGFGDAAHDGDASRALIAEAGATGVIKPKPGRKNPPHFTPLAYEKRHCIEQTFSKYKQFRRIATRYDKRDRTYDSFISLRVIILYLN